MRSSLRVLDDVEPGVLGIPLAETLARLHAPSVRVDLGASSLAEAVWALPAIDAVARRFPGARRGLAATAEVRALLAFHAGSAPLAEAALIVDLAPGHRRRARLVADVAERLAAARWPWDRLARLRP